MSISSRLELLIVDVKQAYDLKEKIEQTMFPAPPSIIVVERWKEALLLKKHKEQQEQATIGSTTV